MSKYPILDPHNFVALPYSSTTQPIQILTNVLQEVQTQNKEIWLLAQDMSKAYDSVHIPLLQHALTRLKIPINIQQLIINIHNNRFNSVITNFGPTSSYHVQDGIDQGETITPLLWCIYYDPLITYIHSKFQGYNMSMTPLPNTQHLTYHTSVLAYMDDTLWLAPNKHTLQQIVNSAESFYNMANITVNPTKSILATNQTKDPNPTINFANTIIHTIPLKDTFRYLGCWFTLLSHHKYIHNQIIAEATNLISTIKNKKITEKQAIYIINTVLIPRFSYRTLNTFVYQSNTQSITNSYMQVAKHKAGLASTIPNSTIFHHQIYNLRKLTDIQTQNHISSLHTQLNNSLTASSIKILLQHLQQATLSSINILHSPNYILPTKFHNTLIAQTIRTAHQLNIHIQNLPNSWPKPTTYKGTPIDTLIKHCSKPTQIKSLTNKANIYAIEQLTNHTNTQLLSWQCIAYKTQKIPRGRIPKWFQELQHTFYAFTTPYIPTIAPNPFTTNSIALKRSAWVLNKIKNTPIIGKIKKSPIQTTQYT